MTPLKRLAVMTGGAALVIGVIGVGTIVRCRTLIEGRYVCKAFMYLDGSSTVVVFEQGTISTITTSAAGAVKVDIVGSYERIDDRRFRILDRTLDTEYTVHPNVVGLWMDEKDARRLNLAMPTIGPLWFIRKPW